MSLKTALTEAMKTAMRAQDKGRLEVIRLMQAAIKQVEVDQGKRDEGLNDAEVLAVLDKMVKQRRDAVEQFIAGARQDLADKENFEIGIIQEFLPQALTEAEVESHIKEAIATIGAKTMADMGKVMNDLKPKLQGRADMTKVSAQIKALLA